MKNKDKAKIMDKAAYDINIAKDRMNDAVTILEESGMVKDAETLARMLLKLEMFQTKYDRYRF